MNSFKKIIFVSSSVLFLLHFSFVLIYLSDGKYTPDSVNRTVNLYINPVFHQTWKIFAPEPPQWNILLVYRCRFSDGNQSKWKEPGLFWLYMHHSNRFSFYGKMYAIHTEIARELYNAREKIIQQDSTNFEKKIAGTKEYRIAIKYLLREAQKEFSEQKIISVEIVYAALFLPKFSERNNINGKKNYFILKFPKYFLENENAENKIFFE